MVEKEEITREEFIEKLKEAFEYMKNKPIEYYGSKEKPYYCMVNNICYLEIKKQKLVDENDMYRTPTGEWVKIINVEIPVKVEVKPYEVEKEKNPFCNTFKKPFYHDLFKQNNSAYSVKVLGKWNKK